MLVVSRRWGHAWRQALIDEWFTLGKGTPLLEAGAVSCPSPPLPLPPASPDYFLSPMLHSFLVLPVSNWQAPMADQGQL